LWAPHSTDIIQNRVIVAVEINRITSYVSHWILTFNVWNVPPILYISREKRNVKFYINSEILVREQFITVYSCTVYSYTFVYVWFTKIYIHIYRGDGRNRIVYFSFCKRFSRSSARYVWLIIYFKCFEIYYNQYWPISSYKVIKNK